MSDLAARGGTEALERSHKRAWKSKNWPFTNRSTRLDLPAPMSPSSTCDAGEASSETPGWESLVGALGSWTLLPTAARPHSPCGRGLQQRTGWGRPPGRSRGCKRGKVNQVPDKQEPMEEARGAAAHQLRLGGRGGGGRRHGPKPLPGKASRRVFLLLPCFSRLGAPYARLASGRR